jgi:uncharacterized repeat protein (TIGR03803 family)
MRKSLCASSGIVLAAIILFFASTVHAATETTLHDFSQFSGDGAFPESNLIFDISGNLYGTTRAGGNGFGTVFKMSPNGDGTWSETVIHKFNWALGDGATPAGGLAIDPNGNLYGATQSGQGTVGTIYKLSPNPDGSYTQSLIYTFLDCNLACEPAAGVILDSAGNLYGTTMFGGPGIAGTVFELSPAGGTWQFSILYTFQDGAADGAAPVAALLLDGKGNLYGTCSKGGSTNAGTVFQLSRSGGVWRESTLHFFGTGTDGKGPVADLIFGSRGQLLGTTNTGGSGACTNGCGTVFQITRKNGVWTEKVIHNFTTIYSKQPFGSLAIDSAGNLYGTTAYINGSVFELSPLAGGKWAFSTLYFFQAQYFPLAGLVLDGSGNLYGTTELSGFTGPDGVVFEVTP